MWASGGMLSFKVVVTRPPRPSSIVPRGAGFLVYLYGRLYWAAVRRRLPGVSIVLANLPGQGPILGCAFLLVEVLRLSSRPSALRGAPVVTCP